MSRSWPPELSGRPPQDSAGDDDLFTEEELSWEDDGAVDRAEAPPRWPSGRPRPDAETAPYRRRRVVAGAAVAVLVVVAIVLAVTLGGGGGSSAEETGTTGPQVTQPTETTPATTPSAPTVTVAGGALHQGDTGAQVRNLQNALRQLGFDIGKADGAFGPKTLAAVIAFQKQHDLTADGVVGAKTAAAINAATAA